MTQLVALLENAVISINEEIVSSQKRLDALKQSWLSAMKNLQKEKESTMPVNTRKPRQFDWLKAHLGWFDKLAPGSPDMEHMTQERWEELLGDGIDRYVASSTSFMGKDVPLEYLFPEKK